MEKNESPDKNPRNKNPMTSGSSPAKADTPESFASMQGIPVIYGTFIAQQQISGPIPSPDVLRQYEAMSPGAADRLLRLAEQEFDQEMQVMAQRTDQSKAER